MKIKVGTCEEQTTNGHTYPLVIIFPALVDVKCLPVTGVDGTTLVGVASNFNIDDNTIYANVIIKDPVINQMLTDGDIRGGLVGRGLIDDNGIITEYTLLGVQMVLNV